MRCPTKSIPADAMDEVKEVTRWWLLLIIGITTFEQFIPNTAKQKRLVFIFIRLNSPSRKLQWLCYYRWDPAKWMSLQQQWSTVKLPRIGTNQNPVWHTVFVIAWDCIAWQLAMAAPSTRGIAVEIELLGLIALIMTLMASSDHSYTLMTKLSLVAL